MTLHRYFQPQNGLPAPKGSISSIIPSQAVAQANQEVLGGSAARQRLCYTGVCTLKFFASITVITQKFFARNMSKRKISRCTVLRLNQKLCLEVSIFSWKIHLGKPRFSRTTLHFTLSHSFHNKLNGTCSFLSVIHITLQYHLHWWKCLWFFKFFKPESLRKGSLQVVAESLSIITCM